MEGSFDELMTIIEYPRYVLFGINLAILLAVVRHERCFALENIDGLMQYVVVCHCLAERCHH